MEIQDKHFRLIFERMPDPAFFHDDQYRLLLCNNAYYLTAGVSAEESLGKPYWQIFPKSEGPLPCCREVLESEALLSSQEEFTVGEKTYTSYSVVERDLTGKSLIAFHFMRDITYESEANGKLQKLESQFRALFLLSPDAIMLTDEVGFFDCNPATLKMFSCKSMQDFIGKHPSYFSPEYQPNGRDSKSLANEYILLALKQGAHRFEWTHQRLDGSLFPAEVLLIAFERDHRTVLQGTVTDITARKQAEQLIERNTAKLNKALADIVTVMSKTMELRDPYTAGHQKRVADIACLIAKELGFDEERIKGLRMAGLIHDIGKIAIPSELLTKPSKLSQFERNLMEEHSEHGYHLIEDIDFPWRVADFVRQHHERIDGSGYPLGLKGEDITSEARILAVADTIESMSTHRPYRPALGLDVALAEIKKEAGTRLDAKVVDAALHLLMGKTSIDDVIDVS